MFNRYWRSYPWYFQLFQLIILTFVMISFFGGVVSALLVPKLTGYTAFEIAGIGKDSPAGLRHAALLAQGVFSFGLFVIVPLLFAYATHPRPAEYLGLRAPGKAMQPLLVVLLMIGLIPVEIQIQTWIKELPWSESIRAGEQKREEMVAGMMNMQYAWEYLVLLLVVALLPAVGEELFFRGIFMQFAAKRFRYMGLAILTSSIFFALFHFSVFNFTSILLAGAVLGIIYWRTGSLWMSILGHFVSNGVQVTLLYAAKGNTTIKNLMEANEAPMWMVMTGGIVALIAFAALWKNSTELPPRWMEDYAEGELATETEEQRP